MCLLFIYLCIIYLGFKPIRVVFHQGSKIQTLSFFNFFSTIKISHVTKCRLSIFTKFYPTVLLPSTKVLLHIFKLKEMTILLQIIVFSSFNRKQNSWTIFVISLFSNFCSFE